jgi:Spy/CpxP family protein refolding chaperone
VDAVLSPEQLTQLKEILFRAYVGDLWMNRLGTANEFAPAVSEGQKAQLLKIRGEYREKVLKFREDREKIASLSQEKVDNALQVFTPEQQKKLREMAEMWTGSAPYSNVRAGVAAQPRMPRPIPYWGEATFQRELRVTQEQEPKLEVILRDYVKDTSLLRRPMTPGTLREQNIEAQKEILRLAQEARKQAEAVLSPEQVTKLNEIEFREYFLMHSPGWMQRGPSWDGPGLNEDQKREFGKLLDDLRDKTSQLHQETVDNALRVLTPEQQKKLRELQAAEPRF